MEKESIMDVDNGLEPVKAQVKEASALPADLIRFAGVILVILLHSSIESYTGLPLSPFNSNVYWWTTTIFDSIARPAVSLFIILTGALLLQPTKVNEPIKVFLKKRFARIGYAFVFWTIVYLIWGHLIQNQPLTVNSIVQGFTSGAYYHLWFLYLITGLYLLTPVLRVVVTYGSERLLRYLIILWFLGVAVLPLINLLTMVSISSLLFLIGGWIGYFLLGAYLPKLKWRTSRLIVLLVLGYFFTAAGAWIMVNPFHFAGQYYFFFDSLTINVIVASIALFMLLSRVPVDWPGIRHPNLKKFIHTVSQYSLPIYLLQLIIIESLQRGFFGFKISLLVINPIIEIPLITIVTLFITLGLVIAMKQVPILKKLIG
jgi:surface polysaccharide O-acyltransferase-like enzyme